MTKTFSRLLPFALLALTFTLTAAAQYQYTETTLYTFSGQKDGNQPTRNLVADQSGNLYGATTYGGGGCSGKGCGSVFELSPKSGGGWTESIIFAFNGTTEGESPVGNLLIDAAGNLYGSTFFGGASGSGVVFELSPSATGWTETVLYSFTGSSDGGAPAGITFDASGNIFGTANEGGANTWGAIFELSPNSSGGWNESAIYSFTNGSDGSQPYGGLVLDASGRLYGVATTGGSNTNCSGGCGTVFRLSPSSAGWRFSRLYAFQGPGGATPYGPVVLDPSGNVYGVTRSGGHGYGVVYELIPNTVGGWKELLIHDFNNGTDGAIPTNGVTMDPAGNIYGATESVNFSGITTVFRVKPVAGVFSVIYTFPATDVGLIPESPSFFDASGNLYGLTLGGGSRDQGLVYELSPPASSR